MIEHSERNGAAPEEHCYAESGAHYPLSRAFIAAHLLTASADQAERALEEAIDSWNPEEDGEEALFYRVLDVAVRRPSALSKSIEPEARSTLLPSLQGVLRLAPRLRHCFVLRVLVGLSKQDSAQLLRLHTREVDEYTRAALKHLPSLSTESSSGTHYYGLNPELATI